MNSAPQHSNVTHIAVTRGAMPFGRSMKGKALAFQQRACRDQPSASLHFQTADRDLLRVPPLLQLKCHGRFS
jgi:hypothetical protein